MPDVESLTILGLGFLLGARHALDADHVAAVATLVTHGPGLRRSWWVGFTWGLGHTGVLLAVGICVLTMRVSVPWSFERLFEFAVGGMLVWLGGSLALKLARERWHLHAHLHGGAVHLHLHSHERAGDHQHRHSFPASSKPVLIGMVHGLAGSAGLMLVVLTAVRSPIEGVAYIVAFGIGSILGMVALALLMTAPLIMSARQARPIQQAIQGLASLASIGLGLSMMGQVTLTGLRF